MVTITEALARARAEYLGIPGVTGVSRTRGAIIFYVETQADRTKVPSLSYLGFPVLVRVVGRLRRL